MKTTQARPSGRALRLGVFLWVALAAVEIAAAVQGTVDAAPLAVAGLEARALVLGLAAALGVVVVLDRIALARRPDPVFRRALPRSLALRSGAEIGVELRSEVSLGAAAELIDGVPEHATTEGLPLVIRAGSGPVWRGAYHLHPLRRGDARFGRATLRAHSPFGLWRYTAEIGEPATIRVHPNFAAMRHFDELVQRAHMREAGFKRVRRRGEGLEFHQLREYRAGDSIRQIDWKATSRKRELISREYESEHDQRVVFLLDCSRRMRAKDGELSHFDHSLNALILLAHVALKGGDAVGLLSFGEERRWMPPTKGAQTVSELLQRVYDLEPSTLGTDFRGVAEEVGRRQRKRSMLVWLTHLEPEDAEELMPALAQLRRNHYVLVVDLRQIAVDRVLSEEPESFGEALAAMAAWRDDLDRKAMHDRLRREGVRMLDVTPEGLGPALVNRYFEAKTGGQL